MIRLKQFALVILPIVLVTFIGGCVGIGETERYTQDKIPPFVMDRIDSQVVNVTVNDPVVYSDSISLSGEELLVGSDLFLYLCYDCHSPNRIFDTTGFYETQHDLQDILLPATKNHGEWTEAIVENIDSFDVAAIQYHIDRYRRNESMK